MKLPRDLSSDELLKAPIKIGTLNAILHDVAASASLSRDELLETLFP